MRHYAACLIDLNEYLDHFSGSKESDKIGEAEHNKNPFNTIPNGWGKQVYVYGFDCENITFKRTVNMFECIYIAEIVYEGVVEPYEKNYIRAADKRAGNSRKIREEAASSKTYSNMGKHADKGKQRYIDRPKV